MVDIVHFSSKKSDWTTPPWLFSLLDDEFGFDLDLFASKEDNLIDCYMNDAFNQDWIDTVKKHNPVDPDFLDSMKRGFRAMPIGFGNPPSPS